MTAKRKIEAGIAKTDIKDAIAITAATEPESATTIARIDPDIIRIHGLEARVGAGLVLATTIEALDG